MATDHGGLWVDSTKQVCFEAYCHSHTILLPEAQGKEAAEKGSSTDTADEAVPPTPKKARGAAWDLEKEKTKYLLL